jgi:serine/threonine-protein kinase
MAELGCFTEPDLRAFALGELPEPLAETVARHLEGCPDCEARVGRWDDLSDFAIQALRRANAGRADPTLVAPPGGTLPGEAGRPPGPLQDTPCPAGFTLLQELGRGGAGVVYRALQHHPERVVALKCLLDGGHTGLERRARFVAEADAIARLSHPHIVQVYAVGEHQGQPFLCLEYLTGGSLAAKLGGRPQPPREAARLLQLLAGAVQHAHERGVVHRDLKPSNVLLAGDGTPKVSDFGLARFGRPERTATGAIVGTPSYMAPEQARGEGGQVGPATDVWALGVILYELLTGQPPFRAVQVLDTLQQVVEREPVPPSRLLPRLPRDLETICLKCLEKRAPRRYATAAALAEDLRRFLEGRPIQARPVGRIERAAKWARRRPAAAALLALTALLLLAAVGGLLWDQQRRLEQVRQQAEREQRTKYLNREVTAALREGARPLQQLHERLRDPQQVHVLLSDIDQWQALVQAGQGALARGQALTRSEPALLGADLRQRLQELERQLQAAGRDYQLARKLDNIRLEAWSLEEGKLERTKALAKYPGAFAEAGYDVEKGDVGQLATHIRQSRIRYAQVAALDLWAVISSDEPSRRRRLLALTGQADPDQWRNQVREALASYNSERLRKLAQEADLSVQPPQMVLALALSLPSTDGQVAALLRRALDQYPGDFWLHFNLGTKAESLVEKTGCFRAALALRPKSSITHYNLGTALAAQKDYAGAIRHYRQALQLEPNYPPVHNNWGVALAAQRDYAGAIRHYEQALRLNPNYATAHNNWGVALYNQQDYARAIPHFQKALLLNPRYALAHYNWGNALAAQKDHAGAIRHYQQALKLDPNHAAAHFNWGVALAVQKDYTGAIRHYQQALKLDPGSASAHLNWGVALAKQGKPAEAVAAYRQALRLKPDYPQAHFNLGLALGQQGKPAEAVAAFKEALRLKPDYPEAHYNLGLTLLKQGELRAVVTALKEALRLKPDYPSAHYNLGIALGRQGKLAEAEAAYRQALRLKPDYPQAHCNLGHALRRQGEFRKALVELRRGHELGSRDPRWRYPSAQWVRQCERLIELDDKLPGFLEGKTTPAGVDERIELAQVCALKGLYRAAVRFAEEAFAAKAELLEAHRYSAACYAALAGGGLGKDKFRPDAQERARLRRQALDWLRADLAAWAKQVETGKPRARAEALRTLTRWQRDSDLAAIRDTDALKRLPEEEREAWRKLWADLAALHKRAEGK